MSEDYEDIVNSNRKGQVKCQLCNVFIPDNYNCIDQHIDGQNHSNLYAERLEVTHGIDDYYCKPCGDDIYQYSSHLESLENHINTDSHQEVIGAIESLISGDYIELPNMISDGKAVKCTLCNCRLAFKFYVIDQHIQGRNHRQARADAVKPLNGIFPVQDDDDQLWCKLCDVFFDNYVDDVLDHVDNDEDHAAWWEEMGRFEDEDINFDNYMRYLHEDKADCTACGVQVPCNSHNLNEHVNGYQHGGDISDGDSNYSSDDD